MKTSTIDDIIVKSATDAQERQYDEGVSYKFMYIVLMWNEHLSVWERLEHAYSDKEQACRDAKHISNKMNKRCRIILETTRTDITVNVKLWGLFEPEESK